MNKSIKITLEPSFDFLLLGLVSTEPIYKISWHLNELLNILLKETAPLQVYNSKKQIVQEFAKFSFYTPDHINFHLIQNKGHQGLFIEEQKIIDFWLKIEDNSLPLDSLLKRIKGIKNINLALEVKPGSLKSKNRLIFSDNEV